MGRKHRDSEGANKALQSELQALIAFACYESEEVIGSGHDIKMDTQIQKMYQMFMPNPGNDDHISLVEQFLQGKGCFQYLFEHEEGELVIPKRFHRTNYRITIKDGCVDENFLVMKNIIIVSDNQPIKGKRLYQHAKSVASNFYKAMALVRSSECPYKDKTYPSGKIGLIMWNGSMMRWMRSILDVMVLYTSQDFLLFVFGVTFPLKVVRNMRVL